MAHRRWWAIFAVTVVLSITLALDLGHGGVVFFFANRIPGRDATGHFVLMAFVTVAVIAGLRNLEIAGIRFGIRSAVVLVLLFSALEELSQTVSPYRVVSLGDLAASWLGALVAGVAMGRVDRYRKDMRRPRPTSDSAAR